MRIVLLLLVLPLAGCTALVAGGGQQAGRYAQEDGRSLEQVRQDSRITEQVQQRLAPWPRLRVSTYRGVVSVQGPIRQESEIPHILRQVESVPGVRDVRLRLQVM